MTISSDFLYLLKLLSLNTLTSSKVNEVVSKSNVCIRLQSLTLGHLSGLWCQHAFPSHTNCLTVLRYSEAVTQRSSLAVSRCCVGANEARPSEKPHWPPGIPSFQLNRLHTVMNAATGLVFQPSRHDHITPLLYRLHWLRALERIAYKLAVLV